MRVPRTLLGPFAAAAGLRAARQLSRFMASHARTGEVQRRLLVEMVALHRDTAFGRDHGFASVRDYDDFRSAVPVGNYETLRPYMDRVFAGEFGALIPPGEEVLMFARTSGTTGRPKHIPVTRRFAECQKRGFNMFGLRVLRDHPAGWLRDICQVSSPMREGDSPTGLPCGAISGLLAERQMSIVRRMYVVPPEVTALGDADVRYYLTLRCGVGRDVGIVTTANPSTTIRLAETAAAHAERLIRDVAEGKASPPGGLPRSMADVLRFRPNRALAARMEAGVARDGALRPRHFWNLAFLTNWTGGTLKLYLPRLGELYGRVPMRDIGLLASEGRLSLPIEDDTPAGIAEITGNFLEFVPAGQADSPQPDTLTAEQVESGGEYSLVVTNWAGLWRYNMDDRVRVCGFQGRSPVFEFLSRGSSTASITGEKLTEHQVVEAMRAALHGSPGRIERFVMQPVFDELPRYELRMEVPEGVDAASIAEGVDRALAELNVEYRSKRATRRLGPVRPIALEPGTLAALEDERIAARGGRSEQYKHQYLLTDVRQAKALS